MTYSEKIKKYREIRKMTHQQFADAVGVSRGAIQQWESGATAPKRQNQPVVAKFMGISVGELMADISPTLTNQFPTRGASAEAPTGSFENAMRVVAVALAQADASDRSAAKAYLAELCDKPSEVDTFSAKLSRLLAPLPRQANAQN